MSLRLFAGVPLWRLWQPQTLAVAVAIQLLYLLGVAVLRRRRSPGEPPSRTRVACFVAGAWMIFLVFGSPLDYLADHVSVAAHMLQHTAEAMWIAPLLVLGLPPWLARRWRPNPVLAAGFFNALYLTVHLPGPYDLTLANPTLHFLEHAAILATAVVLWWPVVVAGVLPDLRSKLVYLFVNAYVLMPLGAVMLMSSHSWYRSGAVAHGLNPLRDQQWGAIFMMLGMFMAYATAAVGLLATAAAGQSDGVAVGPD